MKPEHTRPFSIEHARAGAPFCCVNGETVEILTWDRKHVLSIIGIIGNSTQEVMGWNAGGTNGAHDDTHLVMTPLDIIDGKPVFVGDTLVTPTGMEWVATSMCRSETSLYDCYWPSPAPVYPESQMDWGEAMAAIDASGRRGCLTITETQVKAVADAALRHAIDVGQVVRKDDHLIAIADAHRAGHEAYRTEYAVAARELAIAEAVHRAHVNGYYSIPGASDLDLVALIATVK
ncbi:MAG TPA: hypothetical protein VF800_02885 [Telluria sp.]